MPMTLDPPAVKAPPAESPAGVCERMARGRPDWTPLIGISLFHVAALLAFFPAFFSWKAVGTFAVLQIISALGITVGFHRLLTHRSFKTPKAVEYLLSWVGSLHMQGGPIKWVATHRLHHQHSDEAQDPHSPRHGFFWAHTIWCVTFDPAFDPYEKYSAYAKDLARDKVHVFIERMMPVSQLALAVLLYWWGGWSCVIWGGFVRLVYGYHTTWLVNSATHTWGYQTYETGDKSTNLWWVALLSMGEGWHNNHHAFPRSARHGLKRWEIDASWLVIRLMKLFGLAREVYVPEKGAVPAG